MVQTRPTTLFLLRHAESVPSRDLPESDWPLSLKGGQDAQGLTEALQSLRIDRIVSSPYLRATQTIQPFAATVGLKIEVLADLRERKLTPEFDGNWSQLTRQAWQDLSFTVPGGESGYDAQHRIVRCLRQTVAQHPGENILASSHGNAIGLFLNSLDTSFGYASWAAMAMPDLFRIDADDFNWRWEPVAI